jgi:hypothetical protein
MSRPEAAQAAVGQTLFDFRGSKVTCGTGISRGSTTMLYDRYVKRQNKTDTSRDNIDLCKETQKISRENEALTWQKIQNVGGYFAQPW